MNEKQKAVDDAKRELHAAERVYRDAALARDEAGNRVAEAQSKLRRALFNRDEMTEPCNA